MGLAFDGDSLWEANTDCSESASCAPDEIHDLSTAGAVLSTFPAIGAHPTGMAFDGVEAPVPAVSYHGMIVLVFLMLTASVVALLRQRRSSA